MSDSHLFLVVTKEVNTDMQKQWIKWAEILTTETRKEDGCIFYSFQKSSNNANRFVIIEEWESQDHLDAHFQAPHFKKYVPLMDGISATLCLDKCDKYLTGSFFPFRQRVANHGSRVFVIVTKNIDTDKQEQWLEWAETLTTETRKEDGCILYSFWRSASNTNRFVIIEEWESQEHLQAHFNTPHFTKYVPMMDGISTTAFLDVCDREVTCSETPPRPLAGRILVLYDSSTFCTAQMALQVAKGVEQYGIFEVRIRTVPGPANDWDARGVPAKLEPWERHPDACFEDVIWADGIACGTPTNLGCVSWKMKKFWDDFSQAGYFGIIDGKIGCSFTSQGGHGGGAELVCTAMNNILLNFGMSTFGVTDYVGFKNTLHYGAVCAKAPRDNFEQYACRRLGIRLAEMVGHYVMGHMALHPMLSTRRKDIKRWGYPGIPPRDTTMEDIEAHEEKCSHERLALGESLVTTCATHRICDDHPSDVPFRVLIYTRMDDYVHGSTPAAAVWLYEACKERGMAPVVSDDNSLLEISDDGASEVFELIIFVNNSGQIFDTSKETVSAHIEAGRAVMGVHAALACFLDGKDASGETLLGSTTNIIEDIFRAHFRNHPPVQTGTVRVNRDAISKLGADTNSMLGPVPGTFSHTDEFFNFSRNPIEDSDVTVLAYVDESTYTGGLMGDQHPVVWQYNKGPNKAPIFYCALGHFAHFYNGKVSNHVTDFLQAGLNFCSGNKK